MSRKMNFIVSICILALLAGMTALYLLSDKNAPPADNQTLTSIRQIKLSDPVISGGMPLNDTLYNRRSVRVYGDLPILENELSQLLWSASGITDPAAGLRTAPSAGALYPLEIYIAVASVEGLEPGLYKYSQEAHLLHLIKTDDLRINIYEAALRQEWIKEAAVVFIITAVFERTSAVYGSRSDRYVYIEVGHLAQNIYLQAEALSLGTVAIGAFDDKALADILELPENESPVYIMPAGRKAVK